MPAEDYTITNCTMLSGHGGVVIGSEMSGDVKKIVISNCVFDGTDRGIRIKTARGRGGVVEDIRVSNIVMKNICEQAFTMDMQYSKTKPEPVSERTPKFRNIHFSNITADTKTAGFINGLEEMPVENVSFTDIQVDCASGFLIRQAKGISFHQVTVNAKDGVAINASDVSDLEIDGLRSNLIRNNIPLIAMNQVEQGYIHNCSIFGATEFIHLKGSKTKNILSRWNQLGKEMKPLVKENEVVENIISE